RGPDSPVQKPIMKLAKIFVCCPSGRYACISSSETLPGGGSKIGVPTPGLRSCWPGKVCLQYEGRLPSAGQAEVLLAVKASSVVCGCAGGATAGCAAGA